MYKDVLEYFNEDELCADVWESKYALRDKDGNLLEKTPDDMHWRLAKEFARIEANKFKEPYKLNFIYECFKDFGYIIPQGSPMYGIGNPQLVSLSNCYVLDSPVDSYNGIMWTDEQLVQISKRRGGVGLDLSNLRPAGEATNNSSRTTGGIIPFARRYSNSIREVGQDGRRGALMMTLSVHHPEVLAFAACKKDKTQVTGANISIRLTNEFLSAVKAGAAYEQRWPVDSKNPKIKKLVDARTVWMEIIKLAWETAEPGLLFWDNIISESPADCYAKYNFNTISTNPCQPGWAKVISPVAGLTMLKDINIGDRVWSKDGWTTVINKVSSGIKKVYRYATTAGVFYGTENHRVLSDGEKIEVKDAESIDILTGPYMPAMQLDPQDIMDGLVLGDGSVHQASNYLIYLCVGENDYDYTNSEIKHLIKKHRPGLAEYAYEVYTTLNHKELPFTYLRKIPERFVYAPFHTICGFLRGLFSANGSVCGERVTLKTSSRKIAEDVQAMLSAVGIRSYYTTNKAKNVKFANGEYSCKQSYDVNITTDRKRFVKLIGFIQQYKNDKINSVINRIGKPDKPSKQAYDIISVELVSEEEVFDITVDNSSHTYWTGGLNVSNCGELPLCALDSCRLLLLNAFAFVENPFTKKAAFNYAKWYKYSQIAQRLMDDMIDLELECIDRIVQKIQSDKDNIAIKIRELNLWQRIGLKCSDGRRTGTGLTGLGDAMAAINVKYGSKESISVTDYIYSAMKHGCYRSSVDIAKELGPFPIWDAKLEKDNSFLHRLEFEAFAKINEYGFAAEGKELYADMQKYGRRNISLLTSAPCGSTSLEAGPRPCFGVSSGIEPAFDIKPYTRRKKVNLNDKNAKVAFIDKTGDAFEEYTVYHPKLKLWMDVTGETDITKSPWYGCCAEDLDWKQRVKIQAAAQRHIDHSISSTVNLPNDVTPEKVAEIYETAWKSGCKGITVYRKGCRDGILVDKTTIRKTDAPKRPQSLPCDIHHLTVNKEKYTVLVGLFDGEPYEVFAFHSDDSLDKSNKNGKIVKMNRKEYKLEYGDPVAIFYLIEQVTGNEEAITRLVSTALRHGTPINFIVHQLEKVNGDLNIFAKSIVRALKKYIKDGTLVKGESCKQCGQDALRREEGCITCKSCGWSKCS